MVGMKKRRVAICGFNKTLLAERQIFDNKDFQHWEAHDPKSHLYDPSLQWYDSNDINKQVLKRYYYYFICTYCRHVTYQKNSKEYIEQCENCKNKWDSIILQDAIRSKRRKSPLLGTKQDVTRFVTFRCLKTNLNKEYFDLSEEELNSAEIYINKTKEILKDIVENKMTDDEKIAMDTPEFKWLKLKDFENPDYAEALPNLKLYFEEIEKTKEKAIEIEKKLINKQFSILTSIINISDYTFEKDGFTYYLFDFEVNCSAKNAIREHRRNIEYIETASEKFNSIFDLTTPEIQMYNKIYNINANILGEREEKYGLNKETKLSSIIIQADMDFYYPYEETKKLFEFSETQFEKFKEKISKIF